MRVHGDESIMEEEQGTMRTQRRSFCSGLRGQASLPRGSQGVV